MKGYPKKSEDIAWRIVDGQAVLVQPVESEVTILNEVGSSVWALIDGRRDVNRIVNGICRDYEISEEEAKRDIEELIRNLTAKRLTVISEEPSERENG